MDNKNLRKGVTSAATVHDVFLRWFEVLLTVSALFAPFCAVFALNDIGVILVCTTTVLPTKYVLETASAAPSLHLCSPGRPFYP